MKQIIIKNIDLENVFAYLAATEEDNIYICCSNYADAAKIFIDYHYFGLPDFSKVSVTTKDDKVVIDDVACRYVFTNIPRLENEEFIEFYIVTDCSLLSNPTKIIKGL